MPSDAAAQKNFSPGLTNLGNTCYMNATVQCLYSVPELRTALRSYASPAPGGGAADGPHKLTLAARELFAALASAGDAVTPLRFLSVLRQLFPAFAATANNGAYLQQDAQECWGGVVSTLAAALGAPGGLRQLFGMEVEVRYTAAETGETRVEQRTDYTFKCNITSAVSHLAEGFRLALDDTREIRSAAAGRDIVFAGTARLARLPTYLTVQLMRFDYRRDTASKCKILREVTFSAQIDVYEFCNDALKAALDGPRDRLKAVAEKAAGVRMQPAPAAAAAAADAAAPAAAPADVVMADAPSDAAAATAPPAPTGFFSLVAMLTHKGRTADSGHYVSFVKQADGSWVEFDDETPIPRTQDKIMSHKGGRGDDAMAYLLLYRSVDA